MKPNVAGPLTSNGVAMLKFEINSLDEVDESLRGEYEEKDGKFQLKISGIDLAPELKEALRKEREDRGEAKRKLAEYEDAQRIRDTAATAEKERLALEQGKFEEAYNTKAQRTSELEQQLAESQAVNATMLEKTKDSQINAELSRVASMVTSQGDKQRDVIQLYKSAALLTDGGEVSFTVDGVGVNAAQLAEIIREQKPWLADGSGNSGSGAAGNNNGGGATKVLKDMNDRERVEFKRNDPEGFKRQIKGT